MVFEIESLPKSPKNNFKDLMNAYAQCESTRLNWKKRSKFIISISHFEEGKSKFSQRKAFLSKKKKTKSFRLRK
jgi:hypothetical protein